MARMPIRRTVRMTRRAISPRLATSTDSNCIVRSSPGALSRRRVPSPLVAGAPRSSAQAAPRPLRLDHCVFPLASGAPFGSITVLACSAPGPRPLPLPPSLAPPSLLVRRWRSWLVSPGGAAPLRLEHSGSLLKPAGGLLQAAGQTLPGDLGQRLDDPRVVLDRGVEAQPLQRRGAAVPVGGSADQIV